MDTALKQEAMEKYTPVWSGEAGRELTEETIVPDTLPDVGTVVDVRGVLCVRGKDTEPGLVRLTADAQLTVLYEPAEGGAPCCVELSIPAELRLDAPGADEECRTTASVRLCSLEARAIDSRKLSVRAEFAVCVGVWRSEIVSLPTGLADASAPAQLLLRTADQYPVTEVRERTFVVTDELTLPAECGEGARVLARRAEAVVEDVQYIPGKAVFRGRVVSELLLSGEEGAIPARYETEFSQLMELSAQGEEAFPAVTLMLTGAYYDRSDHIEGPGRLSAELHFAAQCVCRERRRMEYLADIYSNKTRLEPEHAELSAMTAARWVTMRQTVTGRVEPAAEGGETLFASSMLGASAVEEGAVRTTVQIRLVTRDGEGRLRPSRCRLNAEFTLPEELRAARLENVRVTASDVYAPGPDVRLTLTLNALALTEGTIRYVRSVSEDADAFRCAPKRPSAVLVRVPAGTEPWALAKRYGSTTEEIAACSAGRQDGVLLIPKSR